MLSKDHKGNDQSVEWDTFCHGYEDNGFTKQGTVLAQSTKSCTCRACNGNAGSETGNTGNESCTEISKSCSKSVSRRCRLYACCSCKTYNGCRKKNAEEEETACDQTLFLAIFVFFSEQKAAESYDNPECQCDCGYDLNDHVHGDILLKSVI